MRPLRSRAALLSLSLAAGVLAGCEVSSEGPRDRPDETMMPAPEADSIARGMAQAVTDAIASGRQAATDLPALYAPDAVLSDESEQSYAGQGAITRAFAQGIPAGASIDIRSESVIGSGDLVVDMGHYTFSMPNPQGGARMDMRGRYLVVLQRMDDGSWKIARQLTDAVGMGGAITGGPPASSDTVARDTTAANRTTPPTTPQPAESGYTQ